ncbi:MAG: methylated-DNA--[protein]-cysteine S-methyltransferase [Treponemataceae bacterium]|nr:MAG: methylated-DNA--[protein]-cysteine S-methyltransferase [Treponemataceae bacterium]
MTNSFFYDFSLCGEKIALAIAEEDGYITGIYFGELPQKLVTNMKETAPIQACAEQLTEYFAGKRKVFDIQTKLSGTSFQQSVWNYLKTIPFGQTRTYKNVSRETLHNDKGSRACGMACNKNPLPIIIPCHRIIGSNGALTGYAGGIALKKKLLELEAEKLNAR